MNGGMNQRKPMASYNRVTLVGHLTRDPEMRYTPKGTAIAQFGMAMNRVWKSDDGEKNEAVTFVDCKLFGRPAETLSQYTKKGHPLLIEGRLDLEQWEDKEDKTKRQKLVVVVEQFQFLKGKDSDGSGSGKSTEGDDVPF